MKEKERKDFMKVKSVKTNRLFFLAFYDALHVKTQEKDSPDAVFLRPAGASLRGRWLTDVE